VPDKRASNTSGLDDVLKQYLDDVADVPDIAHPDAAALVSARLVREELRHRPSICGVLGVALRDGPEHDVDLEAIGPELDRLLRSGGLQDVLAWAAFESHEAALELACESVRGMLDAGELPDRTGPARDRLGTLRAGLTAVEAGESTLAQRVRRAQLVDMRGRAKTYREQEAVRAVAELVALADDDQPLFSRVASAGMVGAHVSAASPAWADRFVPVARTRTGPARLAPLMAWRATHPIRGAFRDDLQLLVTQMRGGPLSLRAHLIEAPTDRAALLQSWRDEDHLDVMLALAALATSVDGTTETFITAVRAVIEQGAPDTPRVVLDAVEALKAELGRFASIENAYTIGYYLGRSAALANTLRERVGTPDLYGALHELSARSPKQLNRPLRRKP